MEDEEIDPAFAEFDAHSTAPLSHTFDGFGFSEEDDVAQTSFERHVFHNGLGDELSMIGQRVPVGEFEDYDESTRFGGASTRFHTADDSVLDASDAPMSLAFELASASESNGRSSSLLQELGFEEEEAEADAEDEDAEQERITNGRSTESSEEVADARKWRSPSGHGEEEEDLDVRGPRFRKHTTPGSRLRPQASLESLPKDTFDEAGIERTFKEVSAALEEAIFAIQTSLDHLRVNLHLSSATVDSETLRNSDTFVDRQPLVETVASSLVKSLYSASKTRENQVRDLTECERLFSRTDAGWASVLSELDPITFEEEEDGSRPPSPASFDDASPSAQSPSGHDRFGTSDTTADVRLTSQPKGTASASTSSSRPSTSFDDLLHLRAVTSSVLTAFASTNDIAQVQSALNSEAGRKLRALRTQVSLVKDELVGLEQSEAFVSEFEETVRRPGTSSFADKVRTIIVGVHGALEDSSQRAQSMLQIP